MQYQIQASIQPKGHEHGYSVEILKSNQTQLYTSIAVFDGKTIKFKEGQKCEISYYFGAIQYVYQVHFVEVLTETEEFIGGDKPSSSIQYLHFVIDSVQFHKNLRAAKRELVDFNVFVSDAKGEYHGKVLDRSETGLKIRLNTQLAKKKVNVFYFDKSGENVEVKGKVAWEKEGQVYYYYGIELDK